MDENKSIDQIEDVTELEKIPEAKEMAPWHCDCDNGCGADRHDCLLLEYCV